MSKLDEILEQFPDENLLTADGFDDAVIGVHTYNPNNPPVLIYSITRCIEIMSKDIPEEEAIEYLEFNTFGSYMGEKTPIWCDDR